jgi:septal ring factor EnvC (AmiA/AmiB activator)
MAYRGDPTGVSLTCPLIDEVIAFLNNIEWDEDEKDLDTDATRIVQVLEMIRKANSQLRNFCEEQYDRANEFEKDLERASNRIDELEHSCKSLEKEVNQLEDTITDLETQLIEQQDS